MDKEKIIKFLKNDKNIIGYICLILFVLLCVAIYMATASKFFKAIELKTFDLRQSIISESKKASKDITIISVDDESYEYLINKYGEWPIPRYVYADVLNYVEGQNPIAVAFDLLFVHSMKNDGNSDEFLAYTFGKYDNAFTAINFDDRDFNVRKPVNLPEKLTVNVNAKDKAFSPVVYKNCRSIISQIINNTSNIGHINTAKDDDGITRVIPLYINYPDYKEENGQFVYNDGDLRLYPYMTYKMAMKYLAVKSGSNLDDIYNSIQIKNGKFSYSLTSGKELAPSENNEMMTKVKKAVNGLAGTRTFTVDNKSNVVLNWYGKTGLENQNSFTYIPLWKVIDSMEGKNVLPADSFKDKAVFIGTSVFSLSDIKSVPTEKYMPGVEIHATLLNNFIDNSFITPASACKNIVITMILAAIIAFITFYAPSVIISLGSSVCLIGGYAVVSTLLMKFCNTWVSLVLPVTIAFLAIVCVYILKYLLKSRDFEITYKLATTDGLTGLYNHRFFQDQMKICIEDAKRAKRHFSILMIDIDFFKKFNDTYGHQAGDAVLRGVAHTIVDNVRNSDLVFRYGGEEMVVILRDTDYDKATMVAEQICNAISIKPFKITSTVEKFVTISLGVATFPQCGSHPQELIEFADKGLYLAKESGRNQVGRLELSEEQNENDK